MADCLVIISGTAQRVPKHRANVCVTGIKFESAPRNSDALLRVSHDSCDMNAQHNRRRYGVIKLHGTFGAIVGTRYLGF